MKLIGEIAIYQDQKWKITGYASAGNTVFLLWLRIGEVEKTITGKRNLVRILRSLK